MNHECGYTHKNALSPTVIGKWMLVKPAAVKNSIKSTTYKRFRMQSQKQNVLKNKDMATALKVDSEE
jgi:hypothetical protein